MFGAIYINMEKYEQAAENLKEALKYSPDNVALLKQYIMCLENK